MGNKGSKKKKAMEAAKLAKQKEAAKKTTEIPVSKDSGVKLNTVDDKSVSEPPVVVAPPKKKDPVKVDEAAVKKAVEASASVVEARRIAQEAKEQASRASLKAEAIIKETSDIINKDVSKNNDSSSNNDHKVDEVKNIAVTKKDIEIPVGHTSFSWVRNDGGAVPFGHTMYSFQGTN